MPVSKGRPEPVPGAGTSASADEWMKVRWEKEALDQRPDPVSGARITRLTGSMAATNNNYVNGHSSPDGIRTVGIRFLDMLVSPVKALLAIDLERKWTALLDAELVTYPVVTVPYSGLIYYVNRSQRLMRASLATFDTEVLLDLKELPQPERVWTVSPDHRYIVYKAKVASGSDMTYALVRVDVREKSWDVVYEAPGTFSCFFWGDSGRLCVSRRVFPDGSAPPVGSVQNRKGLVGAQLLLDQDGNVVYDFGLGGESDYTETIRAMFSQLPERPLAEMVPVGYSALFPRLGRVVRNHGFDREGFVQHPERPQGNMIVQDACDRFAPRVIEAPEHLFIHLSASHCGRYAVSEAYSPGVGIFGPIAIVVVDLATGRHRTLVADSGSRGGGGGAAWRQVLPQFTADLKYVIFNADPDGILNVYSAELPAGFLEGLQ